MRVALLLLALLLLAAPPAPSLTARWQSRTVARISWTQPAGVALTCLARLPTGEHSVPIICWPNLPVGPTYTTLGDYGPLDAKAHPAAGDVYRLDMDGVGQRAKLLSVALLPIARR